MPLGHSPQLRFPKQLPEILPLVKAHPISEGYDILRQFVVAGLDLEEKMICLFQCVLKLSRQTGLLQFKRDAVTMQGRKSLPLLGHHAVPLQIPIRPDVHHDFKSEICVLKSPSHFLPASCAIPQVALE